jgi:hypothetical protein
LPRKHLRLLLVVLLLCLGVACRQKAPAEDDPDGGLTLETPTSSPAAGATGSVDPAKVIDHLKASKLPIGRVDVYNAETDPLKRLGRPGEYVGKAIFQDSRMPLALQQGSNVISFQNSGGIVEIYRSAEELDTRRKELEAARRQIPGALPEYQYTNGVVFLRLGHVLTPAQAAEYETALKSFRP